MPDTQYTQCPQCQTIFRVTPEQLEIANGKVRCGHCMMVFDAHENATTAPAREILPPAAGTPASPQPTPTDDLAHRDLTPPPAHSTTAAAAEIPPALAEDLAAQDAPQRHSLAWGFGVLILLLALGGQYAYVNRDELSQHPQLQPWLLQMCDALKCEIRLKKDLDAIRLISRNVMPHPRNNKIMLIQATFMSTTMVPQPYPILQVKLADSNGQTVAMRRFRPEDYIDSAPEIKRGMAPDIPVSLILEVLKPEKDVNTFFFDFL